MSEVEFEKKGIPTADFSVYFERKNVFKRNSISNVVLLMKRTTKPVTN